MFMYILLISPHTASLISLSLQEKVNSFPRCCLIPVHSTVPSGCGLTQENRETVSDGKWVKLQYRWFRVRITLICGFDVRRK